MNEWLDRLKICRILLNIQFIDWLSSACKSWSNMLHCRKLDAESLNLFYIFNLTACWLITEHVYIGGQDCPNLSNRILWDSSLLQGYGLQVPTSGLQKVWTGLKLVCMPEVWTKFQVSFPQTDLSKPESMIQYMNAFVVWMISDALICSLNRYYIWNWSVLILVSTKFATGLHIQWHAIFCFGLACAWIWFALCLSAPTGSTCQGPLRMVRGPEHGLWVDVVKLAATPCAPVLVTQDSHSPYLKSWLLLLLIAAGMVP